MFINKITARFFFVFFGVLYVNRQSTSRKGTRRKRRFVNIGNNNTMNSEVAIELVTEVICCVVKNIFFQKV